MKIKIVAFVGFFVLLSSPVAAHHGFAAHFDPDDRIRLEGTVTGFEFINPHSFLHLEVVDDSGEKQDYVCDLQARTQMVRHGYDETLFTVGESIVVEGFRGRRNPYNCEFAVAYFSDGSSYMLRTPDSARSQFAANEEIKDKTGSAEDIFGTWIRVGMYGDESGRGPSSGYDSLTSAGQRAVAAFDPIRDNPVVHCRGGSPVRNWGAPGLATRIYREEDDLMIYHESMDVYRRIHMNLDQPPQNTASSEMGFSMGHFENNTLVINTTHFVEGVINNADLHSEQMTMVERLAVQEDSGRLLISWEIEDPVFYAETLTGSQLLQSTTHEIQPYECIPGLYQ